MSTVVQIIFLRLNYNSMCECADGKGEGHLTSNGVAPLPAQGPVRRMVALYDYDPQELSPNVDAEVTHSSFLSHAYCAQSW